LAHFLPSRSTVAVNPSTANPVSIVPPPSERVVNSDAPHTHWFNEEIQPHEPDLRAYLRGRFPSLPDIDDLIQETYARMLRAREVGKASLTRAYLFVTARNVALDQLRRSKVVSIGGIAEIDRLAVVEDKPDAAEAASHEQELEILAEAIATLPERCREVFILRRYHDLSHQTIAQKLGIAENTVNAQLVTGMLRVREYMRARGVGSPSNSSAHG
jgi:RNA polymerase sigma-70 factor (ECF subfamily)